MNPKTDSTRKGFHTATPYMILRNAGAAIEFYKKAFGAVETMRHLRPGGGGKIMHAEIRIGDSMFMLADEVAEKGALAPQSIGGSPVKFMLYVSDADADYNRAVAAGATSLGPMQDQEYGRTGGVRDPFGYEWYVCTHKEMPPR